MTERIADERLARMLTRVLVFGGRDYSDGRRVDAELTALHLGLTDGISMIIEGGAPGADGLAKRWAKQAGIHVATVEALWDRFGRSAGPKRNAAMLLLEPHLAVAFPGGRGTSDMMAKVRDAGIPLRVIEP